MRRNNIRFVTLSIRSTILLALVLFVCSIQAQYAEPLKINRRNAYKMLEIGNYTEAIKQFTALLEENPTNANYQLALGKAYNNSNGDHKKGLKILEELNKNLKRPLGSFFELGVAYHKNYQFDEAILVFEELRYASQDPEEIAHYKEWIARSRRAKEMSNNPIAVKLINVGNEINSSAPDFLPFIEPDESAIYFTTRREEVEGDLYDSSGFWTADIFMSKNRSDEFSKAKSIGKINTAGNEFTAGRSENGEYLIYQINGDIYLSEKGKKSYLDADTIDSEATNDKGTMELSAAISNDGKRIYFSSDREGGMGGFDIWVIRKLPIGFWGEAQNLGEPINTAGDEMYPFFRGDEDLMYYSSNGHLGMGGMDLFVSTRVKDSWVWNIPENMGFPINTVDDDLSICYASHSRYAYIGSYRKDSYGDLDIYRLIFEDVKPEYTLISGMIMNMDSSLINEKVLIEVFDKYEGSLYGSYIMNKKTGRYHIILPPGEYNIKIHDIYGYKDFQMEMIVYGKSDFVARRQLDILLETDLAESSPELDTKIERKAFK